MFNPTCNKRQYNKNEASIFHVASFEVIALRAAKHTKMLQRIPDIPPCNGVSAVFQGNFYCIGTKKSIWEIQLSAIKNEYCKNKASNKVAHKNKGKDSTHLKKNEIDFLANADDIKQSPANNSAPIRITIICPTGKTIPEIRRAIPTLVIEWMTTLLHTVPHSNHKSCHYAFSNDHNWTHFCFRNTAVIYCSIISSDFINIFYTYSVIDL